VRISSRATCKLILCLAVSIFLVGCGGGGETSSTSSGSGGTPPSTPVVLNWTPPQYFADQTPLDPAKDLSHYEIHISKTGDFSLPVVTEANVSVSDPATGQLVTSFDLANLSSYLDPNMTYYVSMQSVSNTGVKSGFSPPASFSL
jgi:hypothetical protein